MSQPAFEARYRLTVDEYIASQRHGCWRTFRWLVLAIAVLLPVGIFEAAINGEHDNFALIWSTLMGLYMLFFFHFFVPRRARRVYAETKSIQDEQSMQLSAEQAEFSSDSGVFRLRWQDVHKWDEHRGLFMIYPSSAMMVLVPAARIDGAAMAFAKARLAEAGLPTAGKARRA
jgi:hypothetical protein